MLLQINNLSKNYLNKKEVICALKNINLSVDKNEFVALVGPSGCGKSTILSIIGNLEKKSDGNITFKDNIKVGYMFQEDALLPWLTVLENCLLGLKIQKKANKNNISYVNNLLKKYGLYEFKNRYPKELSGGMRQRCALIRTLALKPDILLLDEPLTSLDIVVQEEMKELLKSVKKNRITIVTTHILDIAIDLCDEIVILKDKKLELIEKKDLNNQKYRQSIINALKDDKND